jgi:hypothetical protein
MSPVSIMAGRVCVGASERISTCVSGAEGLGLKMCLLEDAPGKTITTIKTVSSMGHVRRPQRRRAGSPAEQRGARAGSPRGVQDLGWGALPVGALVIPVVRRAEWRVKGMRVFCHSQNFAGAEPYRKGVTIPAAGTLSREANRPGMSTYEMETCAKGNGGLFDPGATRP